MSGVLRSLRRFPRTAVSTVTTKASYPAAFFGSEVS
jgi:hypothetical protein